MMNRANRSALANWWFTVDRVALGCMLLPPPAARWQAAISAIPRGR
jgi:hypothetical protein